MLRRFAGRFDLPGFWDTAAGTSVSTSLTWLDDVWSVPFVTGAVSFDPPELALLVASLCDSSSRSAEYVDSDLGLCGSIVRRARVAANWRISQLQHM